MSETSVPDDHCTTADQLHGWYQRLAPDIADTAKASDLGPAAESVCDASSGPGDVRSGETECGESSDSARQVPPNEPTAENSNRGNTPEKLLTSVARPAMACEFEVLLNQRQYDHGVEQAVRALDIVERLEGLLSVYQPRSELSLVNRFAAQRAQSVSNDTFALLELARCIHRLTAGAFDMTAGSLSEAWGFARRQGKLPTQSEIESALQLVGTRHILLQPKGNLVRTNVAGVKLNPGGIGKGYALDRGAISLIQSGVRHFMFHGGQSSIVARGDRLGDEAGGGWRVALKHPWRPDVVLGTLHLRNQALATSGSGKQYFHFRGKRYSHLIDPRTGWPADRMMSATVVCPSAAVADALATALFITGPDAARSFCKQNRSVGVVLIYQSDQTRRMEIESINLGSDCWLQA